jgi:hypothetical protein
MNGWVKLGLIVGVFALMTAARIFAEDVVVDLDKLVSNNPK